jgi:hypothetical protein
MSKAVVVEQTKLAFDFIEKLYLEVSFLIKEIEGLLAQSSYHFIIGRPSGYGITTRSSTGLESNQVVMWSVEKFGVFFLEEDLTNIKSGTTNTTIDPNLKVIYIRIILNSQDLVEPTIYYGVFHAFQKKSLPSEWPQKFENVMGHIEYYEKRIISDQEDIIYDHEKICFRGKLRKENLFDLKNSEMIQEKIIHPVVELYESIP